MHGEGVRGVRAAARGGVRGGHGGRGGAHRRGPAIPSTQWMLKFMVGSFVFPIFLCGASVLEE